MPAKVVIQLVADNVKNLDTRQTNFYATPE